MHFGYRISQVTDHLWMVVWVIIVALTPAVASAASAPLVPQQTHALAPAPIQSAPIRDAASTNMVPPSTKAATDSPAVTIYMSDGQMISWPIAVFVDHNIPDGVLPQLRLIQGHAVTASLVGENMPISASVVSPHQQWTGGAAEDGIDTQHRGTWLLFDLSQYPFEKWKAMTRIRPEVSWTEPGADAKTFTIVGKRLVNLGNAPVAWGWTFALFFLLLGAILALARTTDGWAPLGLLCADDGHLSLSKCQMALWTVSIGMVVSFFAFVRLGVPDIPVSLVVLMGLSVATTGISYHLGKQPDPAAPTPNPAPDGNPLIARASPKFTDLLVTRSDTASSATLSLTRAQMLLWTVLLVVIFVAKSILSGVLWDVPWTLVALMGVSHTGYLAPKY